MFTRPIEESDKDPYAARRTTVLYLCILLGVEVLTTKTSPLLSQLVFSPCEKEPHSLRREEKDEEQRQTLFTRRPRLRDRGCHPATSQQ